MAGSNSMPFSHEDDLHLNFLRDLQIDAKAQQKPIFTVKAYAGDLSLGNVWEGLDQYCGPVTF